MKIKFKDVWITHNICKNKAMIDSMISFYIFD